MLGRTLARRLSHHDLVLAGRSELELTDPRATTAAVAAARPDVVVNCAAFTAVDRCESEAEAAFAVNGAGSAHLAVACFRANSRLITFSTDYVFDGRLDRPYVETDEAAPRTVYGQSKLAGEEAVRAHCPDHLILRVAWLYGAGGPSFLHTMMRLGAEAGPPLKVVDDQIGNPTSCDAVAAHLDALLNVGAAGTLHLTCEGETTWYRFTQAIFARAGLVREVVPCTTADYPRPAPRPANSRLDKRGLRTLGLPPMPTWEEALDRFLADHGAESES